MAGPIFVEGVKETSRAVGLGPLALLGAASGYGSFLSSGVLPGDTFYYSIVNVDNPVQTEIGLGTWRADGTFHRAALHGDKVDFTAGTKSVCMVELAPLPVIDIGGSSGGGATGGLTDTQLRATPVVISGIVAVSNLPATQPVSGTIAVNNFPAIQPVTGPLTDAQLRAAVVPVSVSNLPATQPVSGTVNIGNLPATQPISGNVAVSNLPATQPVSGTFWQATQPVSLAALPALATGGNVIGAVTQSGAWSVTIGNASLAVTGTFFQATQPVSIAAIVATRSVIDTSRTQFAAATVIAGVACVTAEALLSVVPVRAGVAAAAATSLAVTAGKTLRITAIIVSCRSTSAAVLSARFALRMNPTGAATATSPILAIASCTQQAAALAEAGDNMVIPIPDGLEISGNQQIGLTQLCSATTGVVYASIIGFEY